MSASISGTVYILGILLSLCILICGRKPSAQAKISWSHPAEFSEDTVTRSRSYSDINRASWEPYIDRIISPQRTLTNLYISNQVNRARKKVLELEEVSMLLRSASDSSWGSSARLAPNNLDHTVEHSAADSQPTNGSKYPSDSLEVQGKLEHAIQQIEALNARIHELEGQRRSSWALGRSDESPPGYAEE
ncbi:hypothetical protein FB451DRAFT_1188446 [Mycena latifolia]|nr:hypothetical protein FB451DRAFT_1188446 [Mycena latifolia]